MTHHVKDFALKLYQVIRVYLILIAALEISFLLSGGIYRLWGITAALVSFVFVITILLAYWYKPSLLRQPLATLNALGNQYSRNLTIKAYMVSLRRAGLLKWLILVIWFLVPVVAQIIMHPTDAAGFLYWLNGQQVPAAFPSQEVVRAEFMAVIALTVVILAYLGAMTLFYRRARFVVPLWPLAGVLVGIVGNAGWWLGTDTFDFAGTLAGFMPMALAGVSSAVLERLGADLVFGRGNRPRFNPAVEVE
jgi:hypothetical protein